MKQVIVMRKKINGKKLPIGKYVAQGAHASMGALFEEDVMGKRVLIDDSRVQEWLKGIFTKTVVQVETEEELLEIYAKAKDAGLLTCKIEDMGLTCFKGVKTLTAVGIGPDKPENIDPITRHLRLL